MRDINKVLLVLERQISVSQMTCKLQSMGCRGESLLQGTSEHFVGTGNKHLFVISKGRISFT